MGFPLIRRSTAERRERKLKRQANLLQVRVAELAAENLVLAACREKAVKRAVHAMRYSGLGVLHETD